MKNKHNAMRGSKQSGKSGIGVWVGRGLNMEHMDMGAGNGFSINGGTRFNTIGKSMAFSKSGTPYRGQHPIGYGGYRGQYPQPQPLMTTGNATTEIGGSQHRYIKSSNFNNKAMIETKYMWIHSGTYPNYWVQPIYPNGTLHQNASQGAYINKQNIANSNSESGGPASNHTTIVQKNCSGGCVNNTFPYAINNTACASTTTTSTTTTN